MKNCESEWRAAFGKNRQLGLRQMNLKSWELTSSATLQALGKAGLKLSDMDLVEVNEAFAAQYLAVEQELGLDRDRLT